MNLPMVDTIKEIRDAQAQFSAAKRLFNLFASEPVYIGDGEKKKAIEVAQDLMRKAGEHQVTIELAVEGLLHPETRAEDMAQLEKQALDHKAELGKFMDEARALLGAEFEVLHEVLAEHAAQKAGK